MPLLNPGWNTGYASLNHNIYIEADRDHSSGRVVGAQCNGKHAAHVYHCIVYHQCLPPTFTLSDPRI